MPRSKASYVAAAAKAAATRKANATFAKRSASARKGWATRRRVSATEALRPTLRKPQGRNVFRGRVQPYKRPPAYGFAFKGMRYDFRGLTRSQGLAMRDRVLRDSVGHYIRVHVGTVDADAMRRHYPGDAHDRAVYQARHEPGKPFFYWTPEYGPVDSTLDSYAHLSQFYEGQLRPGEIVILEVEIL